MMRFGRNLFRSGALLGLMALTGCGGSDDTPQPSALPVVGILESVSTANLDAVRQGCLNGLAASGYVDGKNIRVVSLDAGGSATSAAADIQSLVGQKAALIVADGTPALVAAVAGTTTTPVVFGGVTDPISAGAGTTDDSHRPNITGVYVPFVVDPAIQVATQIVPGIKTLGSLYDPSELFATPDESLATQAAQARGLQWVGVAVGSSADIPNGVQQLKNQGCQAIMQLPSNTVNPALPAMLTQARQLGLPFFSDQPSQATQGVIAAEGLDLTQAGYQSGQVAAQVLHGTHPATIPFTAATKEQLIVNLTAAKQFGVTIPPAVIQEADQVLP